MNDDLSDLFAPAPAGAAQTASYRQGLLTAFNPADGTNTVSVGGATLTNLPILLTGAETVLATNNRVLLLVMGNTYLIMGKVATPGTSSFASASFLLVSANNAATGFSLPTSFTTLTSVNFTTPPWANTVSVVSVFAYNAKNTFGADTDPSIRLVSDGEASNIAGSSMTGYGHNGSFNGITMGHSIKHTVTSGQTVTINGQGVTTGGWSATAANSAYISALAIFTKS